MRNIDTFEKLIGKVHDMSAHHYDDTLPLADMRFYSLNRMQISGKDVESPNIAHASMIGWSIGSTRSPSLARMCTNHPSSALAASGSVRRCTSMPRRISPSTITLVPISSTGVRATQPATFGCARSRLRISEMMLVSSRNFTGRPRAGRVGAADRKSR